MKIQKKNFFFGGGGGRWGSGWGSEWIRTGGGVSGRGRVGGGDQGGCERKIEVFVKIQKKINFFFGGGGGGPVGGGGSR